MIQETHIPEIRFKENKGDWEQCQLGEIADICGGGTPNTNVSEYWDGNIDWYAPAEIGEQIYLEGSERKITKLGLEKSSAKVLPIGTVLFTSRAGIGNTAILRKTACTNQGFQSIIPHENELDSYFIFSRTPELKKYGETVGAGSTFVEVSGKQMANMAILIPSLSEQKEIGGFFEQLDTLITLHQRKYFQLKCIKRSMLNRMFPKEGECVPEIRFKGFTDNWKQCKWSNTVEISTEMVDPTSGEYDDMPHIAPGNIESFTGRILDNVKTVKEEQLISGKFRFRPGDVVYGKINPQLGKYFYASVDGLTSADAYVFNGKNGVTQKFIFSLLQTEDFFKYSVSVSKRSGMPKINRDELNAYSYFAPCEKEQERIGNFLLDIDNLITLHLCELEKLRFLKKSLQSKMFPS